MHMNVPRELQKASKVNWHHECFYNIKLIEQLRSKFYSNIFTFMTEQVKLSSAKQLSNSWNFTMNVRMKLHKTRKLNIHLHLHRKMKIIPPSIMHCKRNPVYLTIFPKYLKYMYTHNSKIWIKKYLYSLA